MTLSQRDKKHNWHPYTQHQTAAHFPAIVKGKDALLWDENDKEYIDTDIATAESCDTGVAQQNAQNGNGA